MTRLRQVPEAPTVFTAFVTVSNYDEFPMPPRFAPPALSEIHHLIRFLEGMGGARTHSGRIPGTRRMMWVVAPENCDS